MGLGNNIIKNKTNQKPDVSSGRSGRGAGNVALDLHLLIKSIFRVRQHLQNVILHGGHRVRQ